MISRTDEKPLPKCDKKKKQREGWFTQQISELRRYQKGEKHSTSNSNAHCITILPTYLQFTMMLAVAAAGVPTPLLAMHWYWIFLFAALGLVTFTTVSSAALDRKSELPTLIHFMLGFGLPDAAHVKFKLLPSTTVFTFGETMTCGASDKTKTYRWIPVTLRFYVRRYDYHTTYDHIKRPTFFREIVKHYIGNFSSMPKAYRIWALVTL